MGLECRAGGIRVPSGILCDPYMGMDSTSSPADGGARDYLVGRQGLSTVMTVDGEIVLWLLPPQVPGTNGSPEHHQG